MLVIFLFSIACGGCAYVFDVVHYNLKSGVDVDELIRDFNEVSAPMYRKVPGLLNVSAFKYVRHGDNAQKWEYTAIWVWGSQEAQDSYNQSEESRQFGETGVPRKFWDSVEKSAGGRVVPVVSSDDFFSDLMRELQLGYISRSEAGEFVSSGVYFYTLQAGISITRKLVITR